MSKYAINDTTLIAIGDAIREKEGSTDAIPVADFADRIAAIQTGGGGGETNNFAIVSSPTITAYTMNYNAVTYLSTPPWEEKNILTILVEMRNIGDFSSRTLTSISSAAIQAYSSSGGYSNIVLIPFNGVTGVRPNIRTSSSGVSNQYSTHAIIDVRNIDFSSIIVKPFSSGISSSVNGKSSKVTFDSAYNDYKKIVIFTEGCFHYNNTSFVNSDGLYPVEENSGFERLPGTVTASAYSSTYTNYVGTVVWTQNADTTLDSVSISIKGGSVDTTLRGFILYYKTPEEV